MGSSWEMEWALDLVNADDSIIENNKSKLDEMKNKRRDKEREKQLQRGYIRCDYFMSLIVSLFITTEDFLSSKTAILVVWK